MKNFIQNIKKIIVFVLTIDKSIVAYVVPIIIIQSIQPFIPIVFISLILNALEESKEISTVVSLIVIMLTASALLSIAISFFNRLKDIKFDILQRKISGKIGELALTMDYSKLEENAVRDLFNRSKDAEQIVGIFNNFTSIISIVITLIGLVSIIVTLHPLLLLMIIFVLVIRILKNQKAIKLYEKWRPIIAPMLRKRIYLNAISMQNIKYGKEVRLFDLTPWLNEKYEDNSQEIDQCAVDRNIEAEKQNALPEFLEIIQTLCIYLYMAYRVIFTNVKIGYFSLAVNSALTFSKKLLQLVDIIMNMSVYNMFMVDFVKLMELRNQSSIYTKGGVVFEKFENIEIEFNNVSFKYPHTETYVFKNLNIKLSPRKSIAIVGENGSGKTTLIKLMLRLYEPDEGKIYINGVDLRNIDYQSYLNLIAVVFQDYKTYAFSIRENVAINNAANQERLSVAYKASGLCTKIDRLANGDETILMRDYDENGIEVSGGETQKMAIARALYKNAPIVILDEPTAALDPVAEYTLFKDMQELQKDKLAIFITHRLTSTRFCDQIFVLACGGVHEQGTHKELIMKKGLYSEMYHKQAYYYRTQKTD